MPLTRWFIEEMTVYMMLKSYVEQKKQKKLNWGI